MATLRVSQIISDVYQLCGNLTRDQLSIETVLTLLYHELDKRRVQMNITENNQFLKSEVRALTDTRDMIIPIEDLGTLVALHTVNPFNNFESPIEIVNFNSLPSWESDGQLKAATYGTNPVRLRFSVELNQFLDWDLKFWYEPNTPAPRGVEALVYVNPNFKNLIANCVALYAIPYAEIPDDKKVMISQTLIMKIGNQDLDGTLENLWFRAISFQGQYGGNFRQPYRAGQPHYGRFRR
jgi:hypothetical protein